MYPGRDTDPVHKKIPQETGSEEWPGTASQLSSTEVSSLPGLAGASLVHGLDPILLGALLLLTFLTGVLPPLGLLALGVFLFGPVAQTLLHELPHLRDEAPTGLHLLASQAPRLTLLLLGSVPALALTAWLVATGIVQVFGNGWGGLFAGLAAAPLLLPLLLGPPSLLVAEVLAGRGLVRGFVNTLDLLEQDFPGHLYLLFLHLLALGAFALSTLLLRSLALPLYLPFLAWGQTLWTLRWIQLQGGEA